MDLKYAALRRVHAPAEFDDSRIAAGEACLQAGFAAEVKCSGRQPFAEVPEGLTGHHVDTRVLYLVAGFGKGGPLADAVGKCAGLAVCPDEAVREPHGEPCAIFL